MQDVDGMQQQDVDGVQQQDVDGVQTQRHGGEETGWEKNKYIYHYTTSAFTRHGASYPGMAEG